MGWQLLIMNGLRIATQHYWRLKFAKIKFLKYDAQVKLRQYNTNTRGSARVGGAAEDTIQIPGAVRE